MASKHLQTRFEEEKVGLERYDNGRLGFEQGIVDAVRDIMQGRCKSISSLTVTQDNDDWKDFVFFLGIFKGEYSIWAVDAKDLNTVLMIQQDSLTPYDISNCFKQRAPVQRFRVTRKREQHFIEADELPGTEAEFSECLYIGTLNRPLREIKVIVLLLAMEIVLVDRSDPLDYFEDFVKTQFFGIGCQRKRLSAEQKEVFERLRTTSSDISPAEPTSTDTISTERTSQSSIWPMLKVLTPTCVVGAAVMYVYVQKCGGCKAPGVPRLFERLFGQLTKKVLN